MTASEAKNINLPDLLIRMGHQPVRVNRQGYEIWFYSPFREETSPSFHTSYLGNKWIWKDFGDDSGGTVIDFAMRYYGLNSVKEAIHHLSGMDVSIRRPTPLEFTDPISKLEFIDSRPVSSPSILSYLLQRCIPRELVIKYLREIRYRNIESGREFYGFGMQNRSSGWEVRSATDKLKFKTALVKRDITIIESDSVVVNVFEGMLDFLSLLVMTDTDRLNGQVVIMNSLTSFNKVVDYVKSNEVYKLNLFLDNDQHSIKYIERFRQALYLEIDAFNDCYQPHKDLNDALVAGFKPTWTPNPHK